MFLLDHVGFLLRVGLQSRVDGGTQVMRLSLLGRLRDVGLLFGVFLGLRVRPMNI